MFGRVHEGGHGQTHVGKVSGQGGDGAVVAGAPTGEEEDVVKEVKGLGGGLVDAGDDDQLREVRGVTGGEEERGQRDRRCTGGRPAG